MLLHCCVSWQQRRDITHTVNSRVSHENSRGQKWKMGLFILTYGRQWCGDAGSQKTVVSQMATVCPSSVWPPSPLTESVAFTDQWNGLQALWDGAKCRHGQGTGLGLESTLRFSFDQHKLTLIPAKLFLHKNTVHTVSCHLINADCSLLVGYLYQDSPMWSDAFFKFPN